MAHNLKSSFDVYHYTMGKSFFVNTVVTNDSNETLIAVGPIIHTPGLKAQRVIMHRYLDQIVVHLEYFTGHPLKSAGYEIGQYFPMNKMQDAMKVFAARISNQTEFIECTERRAVEVNSKQDPLPVPVELQHYSTYLC